MKIDVFPLATEEHPILDEGKRLSAELSILSALQYEALQKESYLRMSQVERETYDRRRMRIGELCGLLTKFRPEK